MSLQGPIGEGGDIHPTLATLKVTFSNFDGKLDPDDFIEWMQTIKRIFDYKEIPGNQNVKIVALKLRKYASLW